MNELEQLIQQFLELSQNNPELRFKIVPNEKRDGWVVEFTKGGYWWGAIGEPGEELKDVLKAAIEYFDEVTNVVIQAHKEEQGH
jgi:hypothetical protein